MNISSATATPVRHTAPPAPPPPSKPDADGDSDGTKAASGNGTRVLDVTA